MGLHIHTQEDAFGYEYEDVVLAYTVGIMRGEAIWPSCFERLVPQLAPVFEPINWPGNAAQILAKHDAIFKKADWEADISRVFCSGLDPVASPKYGGALTNTQETFNDIYAGWYVSPFLSSV